MNSLKKNFIYQISYQILVIIFPLLTTPYISRVLGAENIGTYSFTFSVANYFVLFASLGIKNYGNREIARCRDDKEKLNVTFSGILYLHLFISTVVIIAYVFYIFISPIESRVYTIISGIYVIAAFFDISWFFFGMEQFKITVVRNLLIKFFSFVCIFLFIKSKNDLWIYVSLLAVSQLFSQVYLWFYLRYYVCLVKVDRKIIFSHFPQMAILFIPTIAISLYNYMDKVMVGAINGNTQLGFYENAANIVNLSTAIIEALGTVMMPRMANIISKGNQDQVKKYIQLSMQAMLCLAIAMAFGLIAISKVFAPVFWGMEFEACSVLLSFLSVVIPVKAFANIIRTQYLIPSKKDREYIMSVCMGAATNLVFNIILIPRLGAIGAAIGTIVAELCVCVVQSIVCKNELPIKEYINVALPYISIGMVMLFFVYMEGAILGNSILTLVIQIVSGVVIYGGVCLIYFKKTNNRLFLDIIEGCVKKIRG